ncbi:hypothetical protein GCK72_007757 [Caenorhabditis remanei]|uniref:C-type lectin domain-containing protein n=1 Tax=Caenorhabditis remanei TaxID=31234 RepID=A0A6A5HIU2_CAERE|nr:hypothetical protein GCK72_007757 [Caenorhabditis remanei]KAF1767798.1 hypothetical protein GCK72_007757 [Caenorhabditis remanei]
MAMLKETVQLPEVPWQLSGMLLSAGLGFGYSPSNATEAAYACPHYNGILTSIHSKMEVDYIKNIYRGTNISRIYIGAQSALMTDRLSWIDGTDWDFDYMNPLDTNRGMCLVMDVQGDGFWSRVDCNLQFDFLCRQKIIPFTPEVTSKETHPEIVLDSSNCNSTFVLSPGSFSTFRWPQVPDVMSYCTWRVAALGPYRVGIFFDYWRTYGSLNIYDEFGTNIGEFSGTYSREPFASYASFNYATVKYEPGNATGGNRDTGFHAVIRPV